MGDVVQLRPKRQPEPVAPRSDASVERSRDEAPAEPLWRQALGEQLREERLLRADRIVDVAGRAGMSPQYLSELERGLKEPSSELLAAVAGALELSVAELTLRISSRLARADSVRGPVCLAA